MLPERSQLVFDRKAEAAGPAVEPGSAKRKLAWFIAQIRDSFRSADDMLRRLRTSIRRRRHDVDAVSISAGAAPALIQTNRLEYRSAGCAGRETDTIAWPLPDHACGTGVA